MDALANILLAIAKFTGCKTKFIFSPDRELTQCFFFYLFICVFSQILQWKQQMLPHHPTFTFFLLFCKITKSTVSFSCVVLQTYCIQHFNQIIQTWLRGQQGSGDKPLLRSLQYYEVADHSSSILLLFSSLTASRLLCLLPNLN